MENSKINMEEKILEILGSGIEKTAGSMGMMIDQKVEVLDIELKQDTEFLMGNESGNKNEIILLRTQLIGEVSGLNYFLISEDEAKAIANTMFSSEENDEELEDLKVLMTEFLKELENVMAAATISDLADKLDMSMFGDVPRLQSMPLSELPNVLQKESLQFETALQLNCKLSVPGLQIYPVYVWLFNKGFLDTVNQRQDEKILVDPLT